jgi:disulfide bond formation protein DsbB
VLITRTNLLYFAWGVALAATLGSLYFSEMAGFAPCVLCWYQRIAMYPLVVILGAGILLRDKNVFYYALPFGLAGTAIGVYQNLLYYGVIPENASPCVVGASCAARFLNWFGFVDIPLLSLGAFVMITISLILYRRMTND